ncbi:MAG: hypothetical protein ACJ77X_08135 [Chloroflexota bacterium]
MTDPTASDDPKEPTAPEGPPPKQKVTRARTSATTKARRAAADPVPEAPPTAAEASDLVPAATAIPENVTITNGGIDFAQATNVTVSQGGISRVEASRVDVRQGGIARADARDVTVSMGGIALAKADSVSTEMSGVALSVAGESTVTQSFVRTMFAKEVQVDQGAVWNLAAGKVTFQRRGIAGVVIAGKVDGEVRALLDWRGALALGGVAAVLMAIARRR